MKSSTFGLGLKDTISNKTLNLLFGPGGVGETLWTLVWPYCWGVMQFDLIEAGTKYLWQLNRAWWFLHGFFLFLLFTLLFSWKEGKEIKLLINCFNERCNTKEKEVKIKKDRLRNERLCMTPTASIKTLKPLWFSEVGVFTFHFPNLVIIRKKRGFLKFSPLAIAAERGRKCKIFSLLDLQSGSSGLSPALGPCWITMSSCLASVNLVSSQPAASCQLGFFKSCYVKFELFVSKGWFSLATESEL